MLRISNGKNLSPPLFYTVFSVPKIPSTAIAIQFAFAKSGIVIKAKKTYLRPQLFVEYVDGEFFIL